MVGTNVSFADERVKINRLKTGQTKNRSGETVSTANGADSLNRNSKSQHV